MDEKIENLEENKFETIEKDIIDKLIQLKNSKEEKKNNNLNDRISIE